ncbi:putative uncharacterized protein [Mycolicibacterium canariasense]|uniref:Uncharacterized protein n=1 Tax=Mycolicibacterium canariasense TaxID=228230 RepID=A0A100WG39_MYCCR|nr:putative uncharacterized protein [Mycolicibacterium canariasense]
MLKRRVFMGGARGIGGNDLGDGAADVSDARGRTGLMEDAVGQRIEPDEGDCSDEDGRGLNARHARQPWGCRAASELPLAGNALV